MSEPKLSLSRHGTVVGIETSCDETAVAALVDGEITVSVVVGQNDIHRDYGGVVPELASRAHGRAITEAIDQVLRTASPSGGPLRVIDGVAVTMGPGLAGPLMVGVSAAKAIALAYDTPLIGIDHMEGHLFAGTLVSDIALPALVLLVSGGHTEMIGVHSPGSYEYLGGTIDDAAGEAFDKVARMLGRSFPGGPEIEELASSGDPMAITFPRAMAHQGLSLSFSGLKTAVVNYLKSESNPRLSDVAASFQEAVVDVLALKVRRALRSQRFASIVIGGGVSANTALRARIASIGAEFGIAALIPPKALCTDNGAMIAAAGAFRLSRGEISDLSLGIDPSHELAGRENS